MYLYQLANKKICLLLMLVLSISIFLSGCVSTNSLSKKPSGKWRCASPEILIDFGEDGSLPTGMVVENGVETELNVFWGNAWKEIVIEYQTTESIVLEKDILFIGTFELSKGSLVLTRTEDETTLVFEPIE